MAARLIAGSFLGLATLAASSAIAFAQSGENPRAAGSGSTGPTVRYESAFSDYKSFREQALRSWKEANQEVADNPMGHRAGAMKGSPGKADAAGHDMSAMKGAPGKANGPGHDMSAMKGAPGKADGPGHDMSAMKGAPGKADGPGHDMSAMKGAPSKAASPGHDMSAMKGAPGKADGPGHDMGAMKGALGKAGAPAHDMGAMKEPSRKTTLAMVDPKATTARMPSSPVSGTGVVQAIDKASARIKLTHDPIAALGWPKLTLFFRLKDRALAEQVKEGERVQFSLENSASGYVISEFHAAPAKPDAK